MSIRLESGGHTFSPTTLPTVADGSVEVVLSTYKTALSPVDLFESAEPEVALAAVGIAPTANERVVCSDAVDGIVAVMAINEEALVALQDKYGERLRFVSPLQEEAMEQGVALRLDADVLYARVYDDGLRFAEAIEVRTEADILYYLESIHRVYNIYNMHARAMGRGDKLKALCGRCFKNLEIVK